MWFARFNYARGKGGNIGNSFSPFHYLSHDNLKLVGNMENLTLFSFGRQLYLYL